MDALIAKADSLQPLNKKRKFNHRKSSNLSHPTLIPGAGDDKTLDSIAKTTALPKSLQPSSSEPSPSSNKNYKHIANKKLRTKLSRQSVQNDRAKALVEETQLLLTSDPGKIEVEGDVERTWRITQDDISRGAGVDASNTHRREWKLDGGPYKCRYTRNGRHLAIVGSQGHVATFDWQTAQLHSELQLQETCRDITFLHDQSHFAVAQKKYGFIYDKNGVELHRLKALIEPTHLEFLPYHWLLACTMKSGYLKYIDTSTGTQMASHPPGSLGPSSSMTQNSHTAIIHTGHTTGIVGLWTPNLATPAVQLLAHLGPVCDISIDASKGGLHMATAGRDGLIKVWDLRNLGRGAIRCWRDRHAASTSGTLLEFSQRGYLSVVSGGTVNVYTPPTVVTPFMSNDKGISDVATTATPAPPLYTTHPIPHSRPLTSSIFCPYQDILTVGHTTGLSSILVPGSGEPNFDSSEADPYESGKTRREREVKGLLDKIPANMITLDQHVVGSIVSNAGGDDAYGVKKDILMMMQGGNAVKKAEIPFSRLKREERLKVSGKADLTEAGDNKDDGGEGEKEKMKMRGRGKAMKRFLRKQKKNVIDPKSVAIRAKLEKQRVERKKKTMAEQQKSNGGDEKGGALDIFRSKG